MCTSDLYAQMNNYSLANRHFTTSYRLDPKNYLGGIFAIMSAELIGKDVKLLTKDVKESVANEQRDGEDSIHTALLYLVENSQLALIRWLESEKSKTGLTLALDIFTSALTHNNNMDLGAPCGC